MHTHKRAYRHTSHQRARTNIHRTKQNKTKQNKTKPIKREYQTDHKVGHAHPGFFVLFEKLVEFFQILNKLDNKMSQAAAPRICATCVCRYMYVCIYVCMYVIRVHLFMHACMRACVRAYIYTYIYIYIYIYIYTNIQIYISIYR